MSTTSYELVREFHEIFNHPINDDEATLDTPQKFLRHELPREEFIETIDNYTKKNWVEVADGLGDMEYVLVGAELVFGIDIQDKGEDLSGLSVGALFGEMIDLLDILYFSLQMDSVSAVQDTLSDLFARNRAIADRLGISLDEVIEAIHESNMSKLGEDGKPIYITEGINKGKVSKGPNFVPPTVKITELLGL